MGQHTATTINKLTAAIAAGALTAGALATAGLGSAPPANATCASFFGINNSANCTSNPTSIAIAIGNGAGAYAADGWFSAALSVGTNAIALAGSPGITSFLSSATAIGKTTVAEALGIVNMATQLGSNGQAIAVGSGSNNYLGFNTAVNVTLGTTTPVGSVAEASGVGNLALNLFGNGTMPVGHYAIAQGNFNTAVEFFGTNNKALAGTNIHATLNLAFNDFGSGNTATAGAGPLAIAGSILRKNANITKVNPGFNINGIKVGGAAAIDTTGTAAAQRTGKSATARSARPGNTITGKKTASHPAAGRSVGSSKKG